MVTPHFTVVINITLAIIPFFLALYLFVFSNKRTFIWWLLLPVFIAFMPNSAYVLTDVIHLIAAIKQPDITLAHILLVVVPLYIIYFVVNFEFYVISVQLAERYIINNKVTWLAKIFLPAIHFLAAVGVYLGRFQRLESTDIIHKPIIVFRDLLLDITHEKSFIIILALFAFYYVMYLVFAKVNCHLWTKWLSPALAKLKHS